MVQIKQEDLLSDGEQCDDNDSIDGGEHYDNINSTNSSDDDDNEDNIQTIVPFMAETLIETQPLADIPNLFECYLCHKSWKTAGTWL